MRVVVVGGAESRVRQCWVKRTARDGEYHRRSDPKVMSSPETKIEPSRREI